MVAHITYVSEEKLSRKFGRQLQSANFKSYSTGNDFQVESYLNYQGFAFAKRFDPNSYLYLTRAVDYFNQAEEFGDSLEDTYRTALRRFKPRVCLISISSDWAYRQSETFEIESALRASGVFVRHTSIESIDGHDAFLLPNSEIEEEIRHFISQDAP